MTQAVVDPLSLVVLWAHIAGMAAILGGALLVCWLTVQRTRIGDGIVVQVAERYEWIFWGAIGLQVMTGIGNLGAFGDALPAPGSAWGSKLTVKLLAVLAFAVLSVPRTFVVATLAEDGRALTRLLPALYGATTAYVVLILGLAVWLVNG